MKMLKYNSIEKCIEKNKVFIDNYPLYNKVGTKKMQQKFHNNAIVERNSYVNGELYKFKRYKDSIYDELVSRVNKLLPIDKSELYNKKLKNILHLKEAIIYSNSLLDNNFKLGFINIIENIDSLDSASLNNINELLLLFINKFSEMSIKLNTKDFDYTMFSKIYMEQFLLNKDKNNFNDLMQECFQKIYWECPNLITHLKLNLYYILQLYKKQIDNYTINYTDKLLKKLNISLSDVLSSYSDSVIDYETSISVDEYINLDNFLKKKLIIGDYLMNSPSYDKNFNLLSIDGDYDSLNDECDSLYYKLCELKNYYYFEPIIKDMIDKFRKKDDNKDLYNQKLKEIVIEEKNRIKLYKDYIKSLKNGIFKRCNPEKTKFIRQSMNEQITRLSILYKELFDLEINVKINDSLNETSSLYDLVVTSFSSYYYLSNIMSKVYGNEDNYNFDSILGKYFSFIFNPSNIFMREINCSSEFNISNIISERYRLLGLNINNQMVSIDSIDSTLEVAKYVLLINNISKGKLSIEDMNFICNVMSINYNREEII